MADSGALEPDELEETQIFSANEGDVRKMTLKGGFYFPLSPTTSPAPNEEKKWSMDEAEVRPRARTGSGLDGVTAERIVLRVNSVVALEQAIASGIGIGYLPCFSGERHRELARLGPPTAPVGDLWLLTHPDMRRSTRVRLFLDHAAAAIQQQRHLFEPV